MDITVTSFYPPQRGRLAEYADMLTERWMEDHTVSVICQTDPEPPDQDGIDVVPVFDTRRPETLLRVPAAISRCDPDIAVFNQSIGVWGDGRLTNLLGMSLPLLTRRRGITTGTILHNVFEAMDAEAIDRARSSWLFRAGVTAGTRTLLHGSDTVSVMLPEYRRILEAKYGADNVVRVPHGCPVNGLEYTPPSGTLHVAAFGHWSPSKGLETLLQAYQYMDGVRLTVAGGTHPDYPAYLASLQERYSHLDVTYTGFIPQDDLELFFRDIDLLILPYTAVVGTSGVLNLAMGHGVPVLGADTAAIRRIVAQEEASVIMAPPTPDGIADRVNELSSDPAPLEQVATANYRVARERSFDSVADTYLQVFTTRRSESSGTVLHNRKQP